MINHIYLDSIKFAASMRAKKNIFIIPPANKVLGGGGVYRNHPVRPYLVSATPPKRLIGFL